MEDRLNVDDGPKKKQKIEHIAIYAKSTSCKASLEALIPDIRWKRKLQLAVQTKI